MALIPIGPWLRNSTYRVHPLGLMYSTYRFPLLDSGPSSALAALGKPQPSFCTLNAVEQRLTYPNLYLESSCR